MKYDEIEWDYKKVPELSKAAPETKVKYLSRKVY